MEADHAVQEEKLKPVVLAGNCSKARSARQGSEDRVRLYSGNFVNPQDSEWNQLREKFTKITSQARSTVP